MDYNKLAKTLKRECASYEFCGQCHLIHTCRFIVRGKILPVQSELKLLENMVKNSMTELLEKM